MEDEYNEQAEDQGQEQQKDTAELQIEALKAELAKHQEQIERQNEGYRKLQSEKDKLLQANADTLREMLNAQRQQGDIQRQSQPSIASMDDEHELSNFVQSTKRDTMKRYAAGEISEEEKDDALFNLNQQYADRKAQIYAEKALKAAQDQYAVQNTATRSQIEYQRIFQEAGLDRDANLRDALMKFGAEDGLFDYEKARTDPVELDRAVKITKRLLGTQQETKSTARQATPPSGASGDFIPPENTSPSPANSDPYFQSRDFEDIKRIAIQMYGDKLGKQMIERIQKTGLKKG